MPKYRVTAPDGTAFEVNAPEGASQADVMAYAKGEFAKQPAAAPEPSAVQQTGSAIRDIPRQVGLFARHGVEAAGQLLNMGTEPIRQLVVNPLARLAGLPEARSSGEEASRVSSAVGLPEPQNEMERVVGDATRTGLGAMGMAGAANAVAQRAGGATQAVAQKMALNPGVQAVSGATAGAAGGTVREAGGGPWEQFWASMGGGVAGGAAAGAVSNVASTAARKVSSMTTPAPAQMEAVDNQIRLTLQRTGVDWGAVPERIRQGMRAEVAQALDTGQPLNADALRRLLVMRQAGLTPTVGQLTQDPAQLTREMNLAKTGANSTDAGLQRLPGLQNQNTAVLLRNLDNAGAEGAPSAFEAGSRAVGRLQSNVGRAEASRDAMYQAARDSQGRSVVLDGPAAAQAAVRRLQADNVGKLPAEVDQILNDLTSGKTPLTVDYQQQLVKNLYRKMTGATDGDLRHGLRVVREALDNADVPPSRSVNPGNLPAVPGTVPQSTQQAGQEAIDAFRTARTAHRALMARIEGNPALRAVVDGVEPDQFVQKFVLGKGATAADVQALRTELDPGTIQGFKQLLVRHLRDAATNSTDDVAKFSNDAYRRALRNIGDEKLGVFFTREELDQLKNLGEAAKLMQAQPAGSAVNNSNSGALVVGRGLDMLGKVTSKLPFGLRDTIEGTVQGMQQTQALAPRNALIRMVPRERGLTMNPLVAASLAAPAVNAREDDRRR